jgi:hypothetical protein
MCQLGRLGRFFLREAGASEVTGGRAPVLPPRVQSEAMFDKHDVASQVYQS